MTNVARDEAPVAPDRIRRSERRWAHLRDRLRTVTPQAIGRSVLALGAIGVSFAVVFGTWPALSPFVAGAILAYAVLPIANRLDPFMPRFLAALVAEVVAIAVVVGVVVLVVPPLVTALGLLASQIPTGDRLDQRLAELQAQLGTLPEPARGIVTTIVTDVITNVQGALEGLVDGLAAFVTAQILGIFDTLNFLLGLLVIPVWILTVVSDERRIKRRATGVFAPAIRADAYALFRIVDRTLATFLRVQILQAITVGVLIWAGVTLSNELGLTSVRYAVAAGAILGIVQVIPQLGFLIGFAPLLLVLAVSGPQAFLVILVVYLLANRLASMVVGTSVSRGVLDVHPALMIPGLVAIGQLGLIPLLAGAPLIVIARDTVRYLNGRFAEPPLPANLLPGERGWQQARTRATAAANAAAVAAAAASSPAGTPGVPSQPFVPSVYRRAPATPSMATASLATASAGLDASASAPTAQPSLSMPVTDWSATP